jgi:hypothetical protein
VIQRRWSAEQLGGAKAPQAAGAGGIGKGMRGAFQGDLRRKEHLPGAADRRLSRGARRLQPGQRARSPPLREPSGGLRMERYLRCAPRRRQSDRRCLHGPPLGRPRLGGAIHVANDPDTERDRRNREGDDPLPRRRAVHLHRDRELAPSSSSGSTVGGAGGLRCLTTIFSSTCFQR